MATNYDRQRVRRKVVIYCRWVTSSIIPSRLVLTGSEQKHYRLTSMKGGYSIASAEKKEALVVPQMSALAVVVWWKVISVQVVNIEKDIGSAGKKAWVQITRMYHCRHNNQRKTLQRKTAFVFGHFLSAEEATVLRLSRSQLFSRSGSCNESDPDNSASSNRRLSISP